MLVLLMAERQQCLASRIVVTQAYDTCLSASERGFAHVMERGVRAMRVTL